MFFVAQKISSSEFKAVLRLGVIMSAAGINFSFRAQYQLLIHGLQKTTLLRRSWSVALRALGCWLSSYYAAIWRVDLTRGLLGILKTPKP